LHLFTYLQCHALHFCFWSDLGVWRRLFLSISSRETSFAKRITLFRDIWIPCFCSFVHTINRFSTSRNGPWRLIAIFDCRSVALFTLFIYLPPSFRIVIKV
jgi:hypothetical protein